MLHRMEAKLLELILQHSMLFSAFLTLPFLLLLFFFENCANGTLHQVLTITLQKLFANSDQSSNLAGFT